MLLTRAKSQANAMQPPPASDWIRRWTHLIPENVLVLDVACGSGRHMKWFHDKGISVLGVDRDPVALKTASAWGETLLADIENNAWPFELSPGNVRQFGAIVVTNYLWRPLLSTLLRSVKDEGVLIYETFADGNQRYGKPSRPDFLLNPGELLKICAQTEGIQVVAYENGMLGEPDRCVQRVVAIRQSLVAQTQHSRTPLFPRNPHN